VIYEVRITKIVSITSSADTGITTLIEYIKAKDINLALAKARKMAENLKGSLKAVTANPQFIGVFELIEDEHEPDEESLDQFENVDSS